MKLSNLRALEIRLRREGRDKRFFCEFYNLVMNSQVMGRILAFFDLEETPAEETENFEKPDATTIPPVPSGLRIADVEQLNALSFEVKVSISVLGLRELKSAGKQPMLEFRLTNDNIKRGDPSRTIKVNEELVRDQGASCNPYVLNKIEFTANVSDRFEDWPFLQVYLTYADGWFGRKYGYTTLLLFPFASFIPEPYKMAIINMFNSNVEVAKTRTRAGSTKKGTTLGQRSSRTMSGSHRSSRLNKSGTGSKRSLQTISERGNEDDLLDELPENEEEKREEEILKQDEEEESKIVMEKVNAAAGDIATSSIAKTEKELEEDKILEEDKQEEEANLNDLISQMHFEEPKLIKCKKNDKNSMKEKAMEKVEELTKLKCDILAVSLFFIRRFLKNDPKNSWMIMQEIILSETN